MKVAFVCDSGTSRNVKQLKEMGIYSCPLQITDDKVSYLELEDLSIDEVYEKIADGVMMKTSLPPLGYIQETFETIKNEGYDTVFAVPICNGLSGTMNAMRLAAEHVGLQFESIDTYVTAELEFYCVTKAKQLYEQGVSLEEIKEKLEGVIDSASTMLVPVDLDHLKRGGRLTPTAAMLANLLKIKPVLRIDKTTEGRIDVFDKVRTLPRALDRVIDFMKEHGVGEGYEVFVAYVKETKDCEVMLGKIKEAFPKAHATLIPLISTVGCHTGIGCIAIQYYKPLSNEG